MDVIVLVLYGSILAHVCFHPLSKTYQNMIREYQYFRIFPHDDDADARKSRLRLPCGAFHVFSL